MSRSLKQARTRNRGVSRKNSHSRRIESRKHIHDNELVNGMMVEFNYRGSNIYDQIPLILFLYKDKDLIHGINLNYLSESEVQSFFKDVIKVTDIEVGENFNIGKEFTMIELMDKKQKSGITSSTFYEKSVKPKLLNKKDNCYRTYNVNKMSNLKVVNYKLDVVEKAVRNSTGLNKSDISSTELHKSITEDLISSNSILKVNKKGIK